VHVCLGSSSWFLYMPAPPACWCCTGIAAFVVLCEAGSIFARFGSTAWDWLEWKWIFRHVLTSTVSRAWWWANKIVHNNKMAVVVVLGTPWCPCLFYGHDLLWVLSHYLFFSLGLYLWFNATWQLHCVHACMLGWLHKSYLCRQIDLYGGGHVCCHWVCNLLGSELDCACTENPWVNGRMHWYPPKRRWWHASLYAYACVHGCLLLVNSLPLCTGPGLGMQNPFQLSARFWQLLVVVVLCPSANYLWFERPVIHLQLFSCMIQRIPGGLVLCGGLTFGS
jgi:hypothetical protein